MAYGFNAAEEAARENIRKALIHNLPTDDYLTKVSMADPLTFGFCNSTFKRDRIVKDVTSALTKEGFAIRRTATTKLGKYTFAHIEVEGISVCIGAARRGGLGIFVCTVKQMDEDISKNIQLLHKEETDRLMKEQIAAKLSDDELKFLGWSR